MTARHLPCGSGLYSVPFAAVKGCNADLRNYRGQFQACLVMCLFCADRNYSLRHLMAILCWSRSAVPAQSSAVGRGGFKRGKEAKKRSVKCPVIAEKRSYILLTPEKRR